MQKFTLYRHHEPLASSAMTGLERAELEDPWHPKEQVLDSRHY